MTQRRPQGRRSTLSATASVAASPTAPRSASAGLACLLLACLLLAGCSGDDESAPPEPSETSSTPAAAPPLATKTSVQHVTGRLPKKPRAQLVEEITAAVDVWIDRGYGGEYPRTDFAGAFGSFTTGARARAEADRNLLTNAGVGERIDGVEMTARAVRLDVLAPGGRPAAVTAHVHVGMQFGGEVTRRDRVLGALYLTRESGEWKVFGYDLKRGRV